MTIFPLLSQTQGHQFIQLPPPDPTIPIPAAAPAPKSCRKFQFPVSTFPDNPFCLARRAHEPRPLALSSSNYTPPTTDGPGNPLTMSKWPLSSCLPCLCMFVTRKPCSSAVTPILLLSSAESFLHWLPLLHNKITCPCCTKHSSRIRGQQQQNHESTEQTKKQNYPKQNHPQSL